MAGKFCVTLTYAKNDTDKATVAFVIANAALGSDKDTMVFLMAEGVRLSQKGYADDIHEEGFAPLKELMANFAGAGGKIFVCSPCFKQQYTHVRIFRQTAGHYRTGRTSPANNKVIVRFYCR